MARGNNYCCYAVIKGRRPGIYYDWATCERQVKRFSGALFQGFEFKHHAVEWLVKHGIKEGDFESASSASPPPPPATFDPPVHHGSASSASNLGGPFYAVARGRKPGIYHDWDGCREQVNGFSGARYKKFLSLAGAQEFCAVYGEGGHFSLFKSEGFQPDEKASFSNEWARLSGSQGWARGTWQYQKQRAAALRNEIQKHFFASQSTELPVVKEEEGAGAPTVKKEEHEDAGLEAVSEFNQQRHEAALELLGFQSMCRAVGKNPGDTKEQCETILKSTLVNIVDLLNARRLGRDTTTLPWTDFDAFKAYTLNSYDDKTIPCKEAKNDPILRCFLQNFSAARGRNCSRLRYGPVRVAHNRPFRLVPLRVAPPPQQNHAQQHNPRPHHNCRHRHNPHANHNTQSVSTPPSAAPHDGEVVIKKRAMSEEHDDFKDERHQEKKIKTEEVIEAQVIKPEEVTQAEEVTHADDVTQPDDVTHADVIQVADVIVVKEVNVRLESLRRRETKKIQKRWEPSNSIMRNWISSV